MVQRPISIPEPTNDVDSLWASVKALKEAVETIQGIRGDREYVLVEDLNKLLGDINIEIGDPVVGINGLGVWRYRTETSTPPASGQIRFDNVDISSASNFYVHETNAEGTDVAVFLGLKLVTGAVLYIQDQANANNHVLIEISTTADSGSYRSYGINAVAETGTEPSQNARVILVA